MGLNSEGKGDSKQLKLESCHSKGLVLVSWMKSDGTWHAVTAGADKKVATRHPRNQQEMKSVEGQGAVNCIAVSPDGMLVAGVDDQYVRVRADSWVLPSRAT